ncbi:hypothetical protein Cp1R7AA1_010 [Mesorhizobium phage Cp1R7A-A1]|nr:hypothetical protein Cp1R7AA1_010 [Mesorhizobium phage Cp1R7A-A1]
MGTQGQGTQTESPEQIGPANPPPGRTKLSRGVLVYGAAGSLGLNVGVPATTA